VPSGGERSEETPGQRNGKKDVHKADHTHTYTYIYIHTHIHMGGEGSNTQCISQTI